jgi:hypothetical protein
MLFAPSATRHATKWKNKKGEVLQINCLLVMQFLLAWPVMTGNGFMLKIKAEKKIQNTSQRRNTNAIYIDCSRF